MDSDPIPALKQQVAVAIKEQLARHYDPAAALLMKTDLARVSDVRRGRLHPFSLERLIRDAYGLGLVVELSIGRREVR